MGQEYEIVIGLEVHAELSTNSKIFCGCPTTFGAPPNSQVCPVCLGLPGSLPMLNHQVLILAMRAALALQCRIAENTKFDRKNYFYPDLPKAYQISQYDLPLATHGSLLIQTPEAEKIIGITRVHLEEDAGKLVHQGQGGQIASAESSVVDYNRAGVPLIEIVSEPDLRSPQEAYAYLLAMKEILRYTQVSDCNMEEGSLRCDANISVRPQGQPALGTKAEIKNLNSFKHVRDALEYEAQRQIRILREGGKISQETRLWDADRQVTHSMRSKEEAHDYRYFPEPDLPVMVISKDFIAEQAAHLPELPRQKRRRYLGMGLSESDAAVVTASPKLSGFFEAVIAQGPDGKIELSILPKAAFNLLTTEYLGRLNSEKRNIEKMELQDWPVQPEQLRALALLTGSGTISSKIAKQVFQEMYEHGGDPAGIIRAKGWSQISDEGAILALVDQVLAANPGPAAEYRGGKVQTIGFLVGQVMKASQGQADPQLANRLLKERLG